jgi:hypothetical protein
MGSEKSDQIETAITEQPNAAVVVPDRDDPS